MGSAFENFSGPLRLDVSQETSNVCGLSAQGGRIVYANQTRNINGQSLASEVAALAETTTSELKSRWRRLYGTAPPRRISRHLLMRALAYRMQEEALGGLTPSTRRMLAKLAAEAAARRSIEARLMPAVKPGTVLLRTWHGTEHQVILREHGVEFQGKQYQSLSQVARRITGSKWSGPLFFGLKTRPREQTNGAR